MTRGVELDGEQLGDSPPDPPCSPFSPPNTGNWICRHSFSSVVAVFLPLDMIVVVTQRLWILSLIVKPGLMMTLDDITSQATGLQMLKHYDWSSDAEALWLVSVIWRHLETLIDIQSRQPLEFINDDRYLLLLTEGLQIAKCHGFSLPFHWFPWPLLFLYQGVGFLVSTPFCKKATFCLPVIRKRSYLASNETFIKKDSVVCDVFCSRFLVLTLLIPFPVKIELSGLL